MKDVEAAIIASKKIHERVRNQDEFWNVFHYVWGETKQETADYRDVLKPLICAMQYYLEGRLNEREMNANPLEEFLSRLNETARAAADFGAQEKLTVWVRQAMIEFPIVNGFLAQTPSQLLMWLSIMSPGLYQKYISTGFYDERGHFHQPCGEPRALEIVGALQERLNG